MTQQKRQSAGILGKIRRELFKSVSKGMHVGPAAMRFEGLDLKIPLILGLGADHLARTRGPWTYRFLDRVLKERPGAFVDIGANVGLYLIWLKSIDRDREYVGFEPNPACNFYLHELIRSNGFADASVFPLALSDGRQRRTFFARRLGDKMGSLLAAHRTETDRPFSFDVITESGDQVVEALEFASISAIKIDVEGAELEVLRGLSGTLASTRPLIICEILTPDPGQARFDACIRRLDDVLTFIGRMDYVILSLHEDGQLHAARSADDLRSVSHPDRILIPSSELDHTLELWQDLQATRG